MSKPNEQKDSPANEELNLPCPQCGGKVKQKPHNLGHECTDCEYEVVKTIKRNPKYCLWKYDDIDCFYKMCGEHTYMFTYTEERPKDFKFCPYCGNMIKENKVALEGFDPVEERCPGHEKERMVGK